MRRLGRRLAARTLSAALRWAARDRKLRAAALRTLFDGPLKPGTLCLVELPGYALLVDPRDDKIGLTILAGKPWQARQLDGALAHARPGALIDVGANIGAITVAALAGGRIDRVLALEPDPVNFAILERNIALNGLGSRASAVRLAASVEAGTRLLHRDAQNFGGHALAAGDVRTLGDAVPIEARRLDDIAAEAGLAPSDVGLVKIDVEGHERDVLAGMPRLLAEGVPLMVEARGLRDARRRAAFVAAIGPRYTAFADLDRATTGAVPPLRPLGELGDTADQADLLLTAGASSP